MEKTQKKSARNSLIEFYRFLLSLVVLKSHTLFPYNGKYIGPGGIAVEFFFILSGYLFVRSLDKWKEDHFFLGWLKMLISRIKGIFIPLAIGLISNLLYIKTVGDKSIWGYLWYVRAMLIAFTVYFVLWRVLRNRKAFFFVTLGICLACTAIRFGAGMYALSYTRAGAALSLGILLTYLPPIKKEKKRWVWCVVVCLQAVAVWAIFTNAALVSVGGVLVNELWIVTLLYPMLVYFTFQIPVKNKLFNYLGALSFGLYAFQCFADLLRGWGLNNINALFIIIVLATVLEDGAKRLYRSQKEKKKV